VIVDTPSSATQRTYCSPPANHQHLVMAFHLAGGKYWSVRADQGVRVGWVWPTQALPGHAWGMDLDVIGNNVFCHSGPADGAG
jgi:hypothetical protein